MSDTVQYFGIRHHGPGCARSLLSALTALSPDCILIEGPPDATDILQYLASEGLVPPIAMLVHGVDNPDAAVFYPFAEFSPEWQALRFGVAHQLPIQWIDLPQSISLAMSVIRDQANEILHAQPQATHALSTVVDAHDELPSPALASEFPQWATLPDRIGYQGDPLDVLAKAAGFADGETWWNYLIEERHHHPQEVFVAIEEAMTALRQQSVLQPELDFHDYREVRREAYMRQSIRAAQKQGYQRIAVICGAWHVPALKEMHTVKADAAVLKGLPKIKVNSTWIPWTYQRLTYQSGYGAGIVAPGWYDFLWQQSTLNAVQSNRTVAWLARVASLLRQHQLDCSAAQVIDASRLAETLAILRQCPIPDLTDMNEAIQTVMCMGSAQPLALIRDALMVGDRLGQVPTDVPAVPLQRDIEHYQKTLRLKPEAQERLLELDLREANHLAKSQFLHRLALLEIRWGRVVNDVRANRGTFRETWSLQWTPELVLAIIEVSRYGTTLIQVANQYCIERAKSLSSLRALVEMINQALLADLPQAVTHMSQALQEKSTMTADAMVLIDAILPLANLCRYGSVRQLDQQTLAQVLDGVITRGAIALPMACSQLDEAAAGALRETILKAHEGVVLRKDNEQTSIWQQALAKIATMDSAHALLRGLCCRLLLDEAYYDVAQVQLLLSQQLSSAIAAMEAAQWLEGFLNQNALILLHDDQIWHLVDQWLSQLTDDHFLQIIPVVRRSFANFSQQERQTLTHRVQQTASLTATSSTNSLLAAHDVTHAIDPARSALPLLTLRVLLGLLSS